MTLDELIQELENLKETVPGDTEVLRYTEYAGGTYEEIGTPIRYKKIWSGEFQPKYVLIE